MDRVVEREPRGDHRRQVKAASGVQRDDRWEAAAEVPEREVHRRRPEHQWERVEVDRLHVGADRHDLAADR
jgi:hypothetical protein